MTSTYYYTRKLFSVASLLLACTHLVCVHGESSLTSQPTAIASPAPSSTVTAMNPATPIVSFKEPKITMLLTGVQALTQESINWFQQQTVAYIRYYYNNDADADNQRNLKSAVNHDRILNVQKAIFDVTTMINVTATDPPYGSQSPSRSLRRSLQQSQTVQITYDQQMSYRYSEGAYSKDNLSDETMAMLIQDPFSTIVKRNAYIAYLQNPLIAAAGPFENLTKVRPPELFQEKKINLVAIIAGSAGGLVFLVLVIIFMCWWKKRKSVERNPYADTEYDPRYHNSGMNGARGNNMQNQIQFGSREDVSTLDDPPVRDGIFGENSIVGFHSVVSGDPDYTPNYAGAGASAASSAGATFDDATRQSTLISGGESLMTPALGGAPGGQSGYSVDDQSFEAHLRNGQQRGREEVLEIYAPAGKLGVVIDTPNSGAPVVHNIKDTCPVADQLKVGDMLIGVDDEDVRSMTAVQVSRLISQKSGNPTRKFTIIRYV